MPGGDLRIWLDSLAQASERGNSKGWSPGSPFVAMKCDRVCVDLRELRGVAGQLAQ